MPLRRDDFRPDTPGHESLPPALVIPDNPIATRQRNRRNRILDAALATVEAAGIAGYDNVHMRDIAERSGMSLATLYRYFPSKVQLLVWTLERELVRFDNSLIDELSELPDPLVRLRIVVRRLVNAMERSDRITRALTHAWIASSVVASNEAEMIRVQTSDMFVHLMGDENATDLHRHAADLLSDVWTSEVLGLAQRRRTYAEIRGRLDTVIDLIARAGAR